jgi:hypothetical protein
MPHSALYVLFLSCSECTTPAVSDRGRYVAYPVTIKRVLKCGVVDIFVAYFCAVLHCSLSCVHKRSKQGTPCEKRFRQVCANKGFVIVFCLFLTNSSPFFVS